MHALSSCDIFEICTKAAASQALHLHLQRHPDSSGLYASRLKKYLLKRGLCVHQEHQGEEVDARSTPNQDAGRLFDQGKHKPREASNLFWGYSSVKGAGI